MDISNLYSDDSESMTIDEAVDLMFALADEIPQLVAEIAPEGWSKSSYRRSIHKFNENSEMLNICKSEAIERYLKHRKQNTGIPFDYTSYDFYKLYIRGEPFPDAIHYNATILFILCIVVTDLSRELNMVRDIDQKVRLFDFYHINKALPTALSQLNLWPNEKIENIFILSIHHLHIDGDIAPFFNATFRALKKMKYDWFYFNSNFASLMIYIEEYHELKWTPTIKNYDGMVVSEILNEIESILKSMKLEGIDPLDAEAICEAINQKPPYVDLLAYVEVYNRAPQKYPLSVIDYKNLFD